MGIIERSVKRGFISGFVRPKNITIPLNDKPFVTGNGPFRELPRFQPIDNTHPNSILTITIPQSSRLTIRNESNIIGINGDFNNLSHMSTGEYSLIYSNSGVNILINGNNKQYSIIDVQDPQEQWLVLNKQNIIAWSGFDFGLERLEKPVVECMESYTTVGRGKVVVNGDHELFNVELKLGEEILLNPSSLIAVNNPNIEISILGKDPVINQKFTRSFTGWKLPELNLPQYGITGSMFNMLRNVGERVKRSYLEAVEKIGVAKFMASLQIRQIIGGFKSTIRDFSQYVNFKLLRYLLAKTNTNAVYFKVKGPAKLLLNNSHYTKRLFSAKELDDIFRKF